MISTGDPTICGKHFIHKLWTRNNLCDYSALRRPLRLFTRLSLFPADRTTTRSKHLNIYRHNSIMSDVNSAPHGSKEDDQTLYLETYMPPFLPVLVFVFPIMPLFWSYTVEVTRDHLSFGYSYPIVSKTTERSAIREAIPIEYVNGLTQWGGWGIRMRPASSARSVGGDEEKRSGWWEIGYIAKNGGAVKVTLLGDDANGSSASSTYYFSCDNPQKVCDILNQTNGKD